VIYFLICFILFLRNPIFLTKDRHDQHRIEKSFKMVDKFWLYLNKERIKGLGKKIKDLWYGHFEVLDKVGDNAYKLSLPHICAFT